MDDGLCGDCTTPEMSVILVPPLPEQAGLGYVVRATANGITVEADTPGYGRREGGLSVTYHWAGYENEKIESLKVEVLQNGVVIAEQEFESEYKDVGCDCLSSRHEFRWQEQ